MSIIIVFLFLIMNINYSYSFRGQNHYNYQSCFANCRKDYCDLATAKFSIGVRTNFVNNLFLWNCFDECKYNCMWKTVEEFQKHGWEIPQFYGKWPFTRVFGCQEIASVVFSLFNLYVHIRQYAKFRKRIRSTYPMYKVWTALCLISMNGWVWSTLFHMRDFPFTEFMDYTSAFAIMLSCLYCLGMRILYEKHVILSVLYTCLCLTFFISHTMYLYEGSFDYAYNMRANIVVGILSVVGWLIWCLLHRKRQPYVKNCEKFMVFFGVSTVLFEMFDYRPILWIFDPHSLWHLSTAFMHPLLYKFLIADCLYLKKEKEESAKADELVKLR